MRGHRIRSIRDDLLSMGPFFILFFGLLWPFLILKKSFILGDYSVQHLPWAEHLYRVLRMNRLPLWTDLNACGFPLLAEGQAGPLYLLHLIGYKWMPFWAAYTWGVPFHMLLGGVGIFLYVRSLHRSRLAACLASLCFIFGSAYGGLLFGAGSLRVLAWLPLALLVLEKIRNARSAAAKGLGTCILSMIISQQWTGGSPQMAAYAFGYCALHEITAYFERRSMGPFICFLAALGAGSLMALPQILSTAELVSESVRSGESLSFALWGSVPPVAPVSLAFPEWGNALRFSFYIGILPLFLILGSFFLSKEKGYRRQLFLAVLFFSLALGKFNPLYKWAVGIFSISFMRTPSKFLMLAAVSLSVLAAFGLDRLLRAKAGNESFRNIKKASLWLASFICAAPLAGQGLVRAAHSLWPKFSEWYVAGLVRDKGVMAHSTQNYLERMESFFESLPGMFSYLNAFNLNSIGLTVLAVLLVIGLGNGWLGKKRWTGFVFACMVIDLYVFALFLGTGFLGNTASRAQLETPLGVQSIRSRLQRKREAVAEFVENDENEYLKPNRNMLYAVAHPGAYSPLLLKRYNELLWDLGFVDGSLGRHRYDENIWNKQRGLIDLAGAQWVHSDRPLALRDLRLVESDGDFFLYENRTALPDIAGYTRWQVIPGREERLRFMKSEAFNPSKTIVLDKEISFARKPSGGASYVEGSTLRDVDTDLLMQVDMPEDGVALIRVSAYPGWRAEVDEIPASWVVADHAFIGVPLKMGSHRVRLFYKPDYWEGSLKTSAAVWTIVLLSAILLKVRTAKT